MIYDTLRRFKLYDGVAPQAWEKLEKFFETIAGTLPESGKYELDGDKLYVNVVHGETKPAAAGSLENHREYVDIHLPLRGSEVVLTRIDCCDLIETKEYNPETDCEFFETGWGFEAGLEPGYFLLVMPGEPHQPMTGDGSPIVKAIVKIHRSLLAGEVCR